MHKAVAQEERIWHRNRTENNFPEKERKVLEDLLLDVMGKCGWRSIFSDNDN